MIVSNYCINEYKKAVNKYGTNYGDMLDAGDDCAAIEVGRKITCNEEIHGIIPEDAGEERYANLVEMVLMERGCA